ncbi:MAG: thioesterase [Treponema sp.]|nr:thioesterase [Treponema sp.]
MENVFDRKYQMRYFEMNKKGVASPTTILTLLEETAAEHCYNIDYSLYSLKNLNIGWVLVSGVMDMVRYPKYKENIIIRTWLSKYTTVKGYRENIIYDEDGGIIGKAQGVWVFFDIDKRKPVPIISQIKTKWGLNPEISHEVDLDTIKDIPDSQHQTEFDILQTDVDSNKHVNNIKYLSWLLDSLPEDIIENCILKRINARFFSEGKFGEKVRVYKNNEQDQNVFLHTMRSNIENRLLAAAQTVWTTS